MTALALCVAVALFGIGAWSISQRRDLLVMAGGLWAMTAAGGLAFVAATTSRSDDATGATSFVAILVIAAGQAIVALAVAFAHHRIRRSIRTRNSDELKW